MSAPEIQITKSWRKSLSMRFDKNGILQVRVPKLMMNTQIQSFISKNQTWIDTNYAKLQKQQQDKKYYLFGDEISLEDISKMSQWMKKKNSLNIAGTSCNREDIETFYKSEAKKYLKPRLELFAKKYGFEYKGIRITSASTRWGSCSSKKTINFSYRLVMAPKEEIDYVIVHELCHLREMNH